MRDLVQLPIHHYHDCLNFLRQILIFDSNGLPVDSGIRRYYQKRVTDINNPELISFSVFLHILHNSFGFNVDYIDWYGSPEPQYIADFWPEPIQLLNCTAEQANLRYDFSAQLIDLRGQDSSELLRSFQMKAPDAVVILIHTEPLQDTLVETISTPFGLVSLFNHQDWVSFYARYLHTTI